MAGNLRILGAGPAGLTAAITLARAGRGVDVYERRADCGARFGGDLQGIENWSNAVDALDELAAYGLEPDFAVHALGDVTHTNGRHSVVQSFARPPAYIVKRGTAADTLDQGLKRQALAAGVQIHFGETLPRETADIVATGPDPRRVFAVAKGIVFATGAADAAVVLTDDRAGVRGYSYLLVRDGYGCLCTVLFDRFRRAGRCLATARRTLHRLVDFDVREPRRVGGLGHFAGRGPLRRGRTLFVGEAAGLQDLLWGFGIRTAVASGRLAGRCLLEGRDYEAAAREAFGSRLRAGIVNRFLWEVLRHGHYGMLLAVLGRGGERLLRSFYSYNLLQRLLYPGARAFVRRRYPALSV